MSAQRAEVHWARYLDGNRRVVLEADHARIVAEVREKALNDAKRAVRAECYHDSDEWCVFVAAIDGLIGDKR